MILGITNEVTITAVRAAYKRQMLWHIHGT